MRSRAAASLALLGLVVGGLAGCGQPEPAGTTGAGESAASGESSAEAAGSATASESESESESESDTDTGETGPMCTDEPCVSTLTLEFSHDLPLLEGPHRFLIDTPLHELICGVEASLEGQKSCFGFMFTDLSWDQDSVTVVLTDPFFDTVDNPEALPFASVTLRVERGQELLHELEVPVEGGEPMQPDPCGPVCWTASGAAALE